MMTPVQYASTTVMTDTMVFINSKDITFAMYRTAQCYYPHIIPYYVTISNLSEQLDLLEKASQIYLNIGNTHTKD